MLKTKRREQFYRMQITQRVGGHEEELGRYNKDDEIKSSDCKTVRTQSFILRLS